MNQVILRADGGHDIGLGHIYRLLAIGQILQEQFECHFVSNHNLQFLKKELGKHITPRHLPSEITLKKEAKYLSTLYSPSNTIFCMDGSHFNEDYQKTISRVGYKTIALDDIQHTNYRTDIVLNHCSIHNKENKEIFEGCRVYDGSEFAILRPIFLAHAKSNFKKPLLNNAFVCLGGADPLNKTTEVLIHLSKFEQINEIHIVIGAANRNANNLEKEIRRSDKGVFIHQNILGSEMLEIMNRCDIAITSPSTISYEYLCTRGTLFLYPYVDNQQNINNFLTTQGLALPFSNFHIPPTEERLLMIKRQEKAFDGNSDIRILKLFQSLANE